MIRFLFFDVDDTILDFAWSESHAIRRTYRELGVEMTEEMYAYYHAANRHFWEVYERGDITREELLLSRHREMCRKYGLSLDPAACEERYRENLGIGYHFMPHAVEMLEWLKPRCRLFLATNGVAKTQYARLNSAGILPYFEQVFISEEIGANKPMPEYFDYCFSHIPGFRREEAAIVGDSIASDILGGQQAGIRTIWMNPEKRPGREGIRPDYEIRDLRELKTIL